LNSERLKYYWYYFVNKYRLLIIRYDVLISGCAIKAKKYFHSSNFAIVSEIHVDQRCQVREPIVPATSCVISAGPLHVVVQCCAILAGPLSKCTDWQNVYKSFFGLLYRCLARGLNRRNPSLYASWSTPRHPSTLRY